MSFFRSSGLLRHAVLIAAACAASLLQASAQTSSPVVALQESLQKSIARLEPSLVPIVGIGKSGPMVIGTGFFVSSDGEFITAAHVLRQGKEVEIKALVPGDSGERQLATVELVAADDQRELALCRISQETHHSGYVPVTLASSVNVIPGTLVVVSGFPLAARNNSSHIGMISSRSAGSEPLEIAATINEGESGAPIMRWDTGVVVGMVASVRTASTYVGAARGVEEQNSGLALGSRSEWISALITRAHQSAEPH
jgi:Trypsin-like peptidase domain